MAEGIGQYVQLMLDGKVRRKVRETVDDVEGVLVEYDVLVTHLPFKVALSMPHDSEKPELNEGDKLECVVMAEAGGCGNITPREIVGAFLGRKSDGKVYFDGIDEAAHSNDDYLRAPLESARNAMQVKQGSS